MLDDQNQKQHNLNHASKRRLNQNPRNLRHLPSEFLSGESEEVGGGNHSDVGDREDPDGVCDDEIEDDGDEGKGEKEIHILRYFVG